jgi:hypothetical protein
MAAVGQAPGAGARRSRRGYYYQDLYTLRCCLQMVQGSWDSVVPEGEEDVSCRRESPPLTKHVQVKTVEEATQMWSEARLCQPDQAGRPETSILGRLFSGKELPDETMLVIATNEGMNVALRPLRVGGADQNRANVVSSLESRLAGLTPDGGRTLRWCLERLEIEECEGTADWLEAQVLRELHRACAGFGLHLLPEELERLLDILLGVIQRAARAEPPQILTRDEFEGLLRREAAGITSQTAAIHGPEGERLSDKLRVAGFAEEEILGVEQMRMRFSRERRTSVADRRVTLDELADEIAMGCLQMKALRETGQLQPGLPAFHATVQEVQRLHGAGSWAQRGVSLALAYGALHDITGRCQNRYA